MLAARRVVGALPLLAFLVTSLMAQEQVTVATHYYYWYRWPDRHFGEPGAPDNHFHHFPEPERVDFESPDWHAENFAQMAACGIDVALPVYWGVPGAYDLPGLAHSRKGLPAMVEALDALRDEGKPAVRLGLFYDTNTLRQDVRGVGPRSAGTDLTTDAGRDLFCRTVVEYFEEIPERHWARHRGGVLVVLFISTSAEAWDAGLGGHLRAAFANRFPGERLCLVADATWGDIGQDLTTRWGSALSGPRLHPGVAQIGPGYDDTPVPGRTSPRRDREDGAFYVWSWQQVLSHSPELVLIETWNEMHEGSEICPTKELGDRYLQLTAEWVAKLRAGEPPGELVQLRHPEPLPREDYSWGEESVDAAELSCDYTDDVPERFGLRETGDLGTDFVVRDGALRLGEVGDGGRFLRFQVSDHFAFDEPGDYVLEVRTRGAGRILVDYDSWNQDAPQKGVYARAEPIQRAAEWGTVRWTFRLHDARFANRQGLGADFRIVLPDPPPPVLRVELRPFRRGREA